MSEGSDLSKRVQSLRAGRKARRKRDDLIRRIGELTYAQQTDTGARHEIEIARLVEDVRHIERQEELRRRQDLIEGD
ncbi:MAG: hypothetical protein GY929_08925 [Actinomycetia bacterium]|nr:hypothetical protein [Actinomycetes bacterium]